MIQQNGIQRYIDDYDLKNIRPDVNKFTITSFRHDIENILKKNKDKLKVTLNQDDIPSDTLT